MNKYPAKKIQFIFKLLFPVILLLTFCVNGAEVVSDKRVLLLYSYHPTFPTTAKILAGINLAFGDQRPTIDIEYMDSKRIYDPTSKRKYQDLLAYKLSMRENYDLIITADDNALDFYLSNRDEIFNANPNVFLGINNHKRIEELEQYDFITGVVEKPSIAETIALTQQLQPDRKNIFVVSDNTTSGLADLDTIRTLYNDFPTINFSEVLLGNHTWDSFANSINRLSTNDSLILLSAYHDQQGVIKSFADSLSHITLNTNAPIYHLWEHGIGDGILGGILVSHEEQGRHAGLLAKSILEGEPVNNHKIVTKSPNKPIFDYRQLARFNIDTSELPQDSNVRFSPVYIWKIDRSTLKIIIAAGSILLLMITYLIRQNIRMNQLSNDLNDNNNFLRLLMDTLPDPVWIKDPQGSYLMCNKSYEKHYGATEPKQKDHSEDDFRSRELAKIDRQRDLESIQADKAVISEAWRDFNVDGKKALFEIIKCPVKDKKTNQLLGTVGVARDITARKEIENSLQARELLFRTVFDTQFQFITILSLEGKVQEINKLSLIAHNSDHSHCIGQYIWDLPTWHALPEWKTTWQRRLVEASNTHERILTEDQFPLKNGSIHWEITSTTAMRDTAGNVTGYIIQARDTTQQRLDQQRIQDSETRYKALFEQAPCSVLLIEAKSQKFIEFNKQACEMLGYTEQEFSQLGITDIEAVESEDTTKAWMNKQVAAAYEEFETKHKKKSNEIIDVKVRTRHIILRGNDYFLSLVDDLTEFKKQERAKKSFYQEQQILLDNSPAFIWYKDTQNNVLRTTKSVADAMGKSREEIEGKPSSELYPEMADTYYQADLEVIQSGLPKYGIIEKLPLPDGSFRWIRTDKVPHITESGEVDGLVVYSLDVTQIKQSEEELRLAASVFKNTSEGVAITDPNANIVRTNKAFAKLTGYSNDEVIGENLRILRSGRHDHSFYQDMWKSINNTGHWQGETWHRKKDGSIYPVLQNISKVINEDGSVSNYISVCSDISQIKQSQEKIDHLAHHDALTGLPNRLLFNERVIHAIKHSTRHSEAFAIMFVDLDNFKHINDSLGHTHGDDLLNTVASFLTNAIREEDTVARIGGDEFVLLFEGVENSDKVVLLAENILSVLQQPINLQGHIVSVSASIGISVYPNDGDTCEELLRNADAAMYRAKEDGKDTYHFYSSELTLKALERMKLENELKNAIKKGEFRLYYQPKINLTTEMITGVEALIRWQHPQLGMISPAKFIPLAEETGLILQIGKWVLESACKQMTNWLTTGIDIGSVSVNVSASQIQRAGLVRQISKALSVNNLPAHRLELEVTEGFIMKHTESTIELLSSLRDLGVTLAIDDFGTGYSSLSYLKQLPIHKIKIDQSFVKDIPHNNDDKAIAKTVIALGNNLGLTVIAEGVERKEQADYLRSKGCQEAQGYLYSRPIPASELEEFARNFQSSGY